MKKYFAVFISAIMLCQSVYGTDVNVSLNEENVIFDNQQPMVIDGKTFVPMRGIFEKLGYSVSWDSTLKTAYIQGNGKNISLAVGENSLYIDKKCYKMSESAFVENGAFYIPIRDVCEAVMLVVNWNNNNIEIVSNTQVPSEDMERVRKIAKGYITMTAIQKLLYNFIATDSANILSISRGMATSESDENVTEKIQNAIKTCDNYAKAIDLMPSGDMDTKMRDNYKEFIDCVKANYNILQTIATTDKNHNDEALQNRAVRVNGLKEIALNDCLSSIESASQRLRQAVSNIEYNATDESKLTGEQIEERRDYYRTIGSAADVSTAFFRDEKALCLRDNYYNASENLKKVLNSVYTPTNCIFERELMLMCCDLLKEAGEIVPSQLDDRTDYNVITFECTMRLFEELFEIALNDYYTVKYVCNEGGKTI